MIAGAAVVIIAATLTILLSGSHPPLKRFETHWEPEKSLPPRLVGGGTEEEAGSWRLATYLVQKGWQPRVAGPQAGYVTCASRTTCYVTASTSPSASGPTIDNSIYVTRDSGESWSVLPLPDHATITASLACASADVCALGALVEGDAAFLSTVDGGHQWTVQPLPAAMNPLIWLACTSRNVCHGLTAPTGVATAGGLMASFGPGALGESPSEVFATTGDGGVTWTSTAFPAEVAISAASCPQASTCVVVGYRSNIAGPLPPSIVRYSSDGGARWANGVLPAGFGGGAFSQISCGDGTDCMLLGVLTTPNPGPCGGQAATTSGECDPGAQNQMSGIATTSDGGATWRERVLPSDVPQPQLLGLSCASARVCDVSGEEAVPVTIGDIQDAGSAVILGTSDAGASWQKATFAVPAGAPNFDGQSYQTIGAISCPTTDFCLAVGTTAQGSPSAPIYRLLVP